MKIRKKAVCLLAAIALFTSLLTSCNSKKAVSFRDFDSLAAERNYIVQDGTDYFSAYDYIKMVKLCAPQDKAFQIEFYELNDAAVAKSFYEANRNNFVMMKSGTADEYTDTGDDYDIYKLENYGSFMMVERVGNTVVYVNSTSAANRAAIESFLKAIRY